MIGYVGDVHPLLVVMLLVDEIDLRFAFGCLLLFVSD